MRLTPRSARDAVEGIERAADGTGHLKARVRAVPESGMANAALQRLLASALGVPASTVTVTAGATSRLKTIHVVGDREALAARIVALAAPR